MDDIDRLFREYHLPIVRYLARRLGDRDLAEELAQETFVRALPRIPLTNERAWLFTVATNLLRDDARRDLRQQQRMAAVRADQQACEQVERHHGRDGRHSRDEDSSPVSETSRRALAALSERDRTALLLQQEGLSYPEIAATAGIAVTSVGTTLSRARRRLVEEYELLMSAQRAHGGADVA